MYRRSVIVAIAAVIAVVCIRISIVVFTKLLLGVLRALPLMELHDDDAVCEDDGVDADDADYNVYVVAVAEPAAHDDYDYCYYYYYYDDDGCAGAGVGGCCDDADDCYFAFDVVGVNDGADDVCCPVIDFAVLVPFSLKADDDVDEVVVDLPEFADFTSAASVLTLCLLNIVEDKGFETK
uniref:Uncharacterized protein n=1 Tax=Glossina palpalis gambiensis TaxID=67801 RepID=A0A1B0B8E4_9MUSC